MGLILFLILVRTHREKREAIRSGFFFSRPIKRKRVSLGMAFDGLEIATVWRCDQRKKTWRGRYRQTLAKTGWNVIFFLGLVKIVARQIESFPFWVVELVSFFAGINDID